MILDMLRELLRLRPRRSGREWLILLGVAAILIAVPLSPIVYAAIDRDAGLEGLVGDEFAFGFTLVAWQILLTWPASEKRVWRSRGGHGSEPQVQLSLLLALAAIEIAVVLADKTPGAQPSDAGRGVMWGITVAGLTDLACFTAAVMLARGDLSLRARR